MQVCGTACRRYLREIRRGVLDVKIQESGLFLSTLSKRSSFCMCLLSSGLYAGHQRKEILQCTLDKLPGSRLVKKILLMLQEAVNEGKKGVDAEKEEIRAVNNVKQEDSSALVGRGLSFGEPHALDGCVNYLFTLRILLLCIGKTETLDGFLVKLAFAKDSNMVTLQELP